MTHRLLLGSLLALLLTGPSAADAQAPNRAVTPAPGKPKEIGPFNFTPTVVEMDFDGFLAKVIVFKDGQLRIREKRSVLSSDGLRPQGRISFIL